MIDPTTLIEDAYECPDCHGTGQHLYYDNFTDENVAETCGTCDGTGEVYEFSYPL